MNAVEVHFSKPRTAYDMVVLESDGEHRIDMLKHGIRYRQLVLDGVISVTDLAENWAL
jgi:hypothetical protein